MPSDPESPLGSNVYVMRADNHGEGGLLAMLALIIGRTTMHQQRRAVLVALGLVGAAEFFQLPPNRVIELGTQIEF
jgi:K+ transporter